MIDPSWPLGLKALSLGYVTAANIQSYWKHGQTPYEVLMSSLYVPEILDNGFLAGRCNFPSYADVLAAIVLFRENTDECDYEAAGALMDYRAVRDESKRSLTTENTHDEGECIWPLKARHHFCLQALTHSQGYLRSTTLSRWIDRFMLRGLDFADQSDIQEVFNVSCIQYSELEKATKTSSLQSLGPSGTGDLHVRLAQSALDARMVRRHQ